MLASRQSPAQKRLARQFDELTERLSMHTTPFMNTGPGAAERRHRRAQLGTEQFGRVYLPHYYIEGVASPAFHGDLEEMLHHDEQDDAERHVFVVHGPREHGKSAFFRIGLLRRLLLGEIPYFLFGSEYLKLAVKHIEYLKLELEQNPRLNTDWAIEILKWDEGKGVLRVRAASHATGHVATFQLEAISYGTSAKGMLFLQHRPFGCFLDDFENTRTARNPVISRQKYEWVLQEVYPAVQHVVLWVGNMGHDSSALYAAFLDYFEDDDDALRAFLKHGTRPGQSIPHDARSAFEGVRGAAYGPNEAYFAEEDASGTLTEAPEAYDFEQEEGQDDSAEALSVALSVYSYRADTLLESGGTRYLWPERFDPAWYARMRGTMKHLYEGEMNGYPILLGLLFKAEWFDERWERLPDELTWFSWLDPAFGESRSACYKVIIVGATDGRRWYVCDAWASQTDTVAAMIDAWYELFEKWPDLTHGQYENNFKQDDRLRYDIEHAEDVHGYPLRVSGDSNTANKFARIESMVGPASTGRIVFPRVMNDYLRVVFNQLIGYPDDPYNDGPDAIESFLQRCRHSARSKPKYESIGRRRFQRGGRRRR